MKRVLSIVLSVVLVCLCIPTLVMAEADKVYIGVTMQGNQSGFIQYITSGIWEYQANHAPDIDLEVVFADDDAAKQLSQVETFISKGVDAIVINPVDKVQSAAAVDAAFEKGIPVITVNTTSDSEHVAAHVGSDDVESGRLQMQRLLDVVGPEMKVVYVDAVLGHSAQVGRAQGYKEVLDANPSVTLVAHDTGNWSADDSMKLVENWIQAGKEFDAVACNADCQLIGVVTAIENAGLVGKVKLSGMDCDPVIMDAIVAGTVDSSIWQDGVGQGENALRLAIEAAKGNAVEDFLLPYEVCTGDNIDQYLKLAEGRNALAKQYF
ncbi:MAG: substrate-binding domain-containing protein [Eubacteriales bacterium]|nr:substrate-binding domain-containing protein [Eubacteriales bacterium]